MPGFSSAGRKVLADSRLYVLVFSLYPVLFLYRHNIGEVAPGKAFLPMILSVALAAILWLGLRFVYPARDKRALAVLLVLMVVFYYRLLQQLLEEAIGPFIKSAAPLSAHAALLASLAIGSIAIQRSKKSFAGSGRILNAVALALLAWNLGGIILHHARQAGMRQAGLLPQESERPNAAAPAFRPDIYCLVLDEFASLESIRDIFHHDPSRFAARLRAAGFFIAGKSRGPSEWTPEALAALLNMERVPARSDARALVKRNRVARFLKDRGYAIYDFPHGDLTTLELSRQHFFYSRESASIFFDDFYRSLIAMSLFYPLAENWQMHDDQFSSYSRNRVLYVFEQMPAVVKMAGPKFVFAHVFSPHAPFVFTRDGGRVAPEHALDYSRLSYYLDQYIYISQRVAEMAEMILARSPRPPVIVILSDHGYRGSIRKPFLHVVPAGEKRKVFLSLHLPGYPLSRLSAALAPGDVFRVILNHYFGQDLPLGQDRG